MAAWLKDWKGPFAIFWSMFLDKLMSKYQDSPSKFLDLFLKYFTRKILVCLVRKRDYLRVEV